MLAQRSNPFQQRKSWHFRGMHVEAQAESATTWYVHMYIPRYLMYVYTYLVPTHVCTCLYTYMYIVRIRLNGKSDQPGCPQLPYSGMHTWGSAKADGVHMYLLCTYMCRSIGMYICTYAHSNVICVHIMPVIHWAPESVTKLHMYLPRKFSLCTP